MTLLSASFLGSLDLLVYLLFSYFFGFLFNLILPLQLLCYYFHLSMLHAHMGYHVVIILLSFSLIWFVSFWTYRYVYDLVIPFGLLFNVLSCCPGYYVVVVGAFLLSLLHAYICGLSYCYRFP